MMIGGRLCSLMFYRCSFGVLRDPGTEEAVSGEVETEKGFGFFHVAGASLDIVENGVGGIRVFAGNVRGLSLTRDKHPTGGDSDRED